MVYCLLICKKYYLEYVNTIFSEKGIIFCHTSGKWIPDNLINQSFTIWRILSWNNILDCLTWLPILIIQFSLFQVRKLKSYERIFFWRTCNCISNIQRWIICPLVSYYVRSFKFQRSFPIPLLYRIRQIVLTKPKEETVFHGHSISKKFYWATSSDN